MKMEKTDEQYEKIRDAKMCPNCLSEDIEYFRYVRKCKKCHTMLDTSHVIWG